MIDGLISKHKTCKDQLCVVYANGKEGKVYTNIKPFTYTYNVSLYIVMQKDDELILYEMIYLQDVYSVESSYGRKKKRKDMLLLIIK